MNFYCGVTGKENSVSPLWDYKELIRYLDNYPRFCMGKHKKIIPKLQNLSYTTVCSAVLVLFSRGLEPGATVSVGIFSRGIYAQLLNHGKLVEIVDLCCVRAELNHC